MDSRAAGLSSGYEADRAAEHSRMGRVSGGLWMLGGVIGALGLLLPGSRHVAAEWVLLLSVLAFAYGLASLTELIPWRRASTRSLALGMIVTLPFVALAIYLSGGAFSYIEPLLVCSLLYASFFFPPRWAWPLTVELVLIAGAPLLYDERAIEHAFLPRYLAIAGAFLAVAWVMMTLKRRLVDAERRQRQMANRDHLTGIGNRRAFDAVLEMELEVRGAGREREAASGDLPLALLIIDLDEFKTVNDRFGHQAGDAVLRETAWQMRRVLRSTDAVARIGGDEFAIIAPGSGSDNARALAEGVRNAVRIGATETGPSLAEPTIGWAVYPEDGVDADSLMRVADSRMMGAKSRPGAEAVEGAAAVGDAEITIRSRC